MWTVIYMAKKKELIKVRNILADAGLAVSVRPVDKSDDGYFELSVPESETQIAHAKLLKHGY